MTADNDKAPAGEQQSPIQRETEEGTPIIPGAEITLPDEEGGEATITEQDGEGDPEQQQAQPERKPKNRVPAKQRINQLWHEARQAETRAEQLERENAELKAQMANKDVERKQVDSAAIDAHERATKSQLALARQQLIDAKTAADPNKEADAQEALARAAAELANIEAWKASQPKPKANGAAPAEQTPQPKPQGNGQAQPVEVSPEIQQWVANNLWAVNDPRNAEFDPEMAAFMANQANILEQRMKRQGRANEVGTEAYFTEIDRLMREEFPDRFDDTQEEELPEPQPKPRQQPANQRRAPQMQRQNGQPVAPAAASSSQTPPRSQARTVQLSAEERSFAHGMAANGALKYPAGHKQQGKPMAPADAEIAYARQKLNQTARS